MELGTLDLELEIVNSLNWKLGTVDWRWQMVEWCKGVSGVGGDGVE